MKYLLYKCTWPHCPFASRRKATADNHGHYHKGHRVIPTEPRKARMEGGSVYSIARKF